MIFRSVAKIASAITHAVGAAIKGIEPPPAIHQGIAARFRMIFGHILAPSTKPQCMPIEKYTLPVRIYASPSTIPSRNRPINVGIAIVLKQELGWNPFVAATLMNIITLGVAMWLASEGAKPEAALQPADTES